MHVVGSQCRLGNMEVSIQRAGQEEPFKAATRGPLFVGSPIAENYTSDSISLSVNSVLSHFSSMPPDEITAQQYTAEIRPSRTFISVMRHHSKSDLLLSRVHFSLSLLNNSPVLLGQGDVFTPLPLGSSEGFTAFHEGGLVNRAAFGALMENLFQPVTLTAVIRAIESIKPSYVTVPQLAKDHVIAWLSRHCENTASPWSYDLNFGFLGHMDIQSTLVSLSGKPFPWVV